MSGLRTSLLRLPLAALALCAAPLSSAHAVELYWDPVLSPPTRVVYTTPSYAYVAPVVTPVVTSTSTASASTTVNLNITTPTPAPAAQRDPYDTHGLVVAGAGMGAAMFFGDGLTSTAVAYRLHVGVAVGQGEFALRADLVPDALRVAMMSGGTTPAALYTIGATFNYRFLPDASLHPVAGAGVETTVLDPHQAQGGAAFGVVARVGLELAFPIDSGALAFGIDVTGHHLIGQDASFPEASANMLNVSAYGDWRF